MYYTLEDFLNDDITPHIRLLTKAMDFSAVQIQSVSVHELPLEDFVGEHELVLSTAVGCAEDPSLFKELISGVKAAHAAALLLAFKVHPTACRGRSWEYADQQSLPVFVIPWEYRFADIQSCVIQKIQIKSLRSIKPSRPTC